jgi:hypothetical protein
MGDKIVQIVDAIGRLPLETQGMICMGFLVFLLVVVIVVHIIKTGSLPLPD